MASTVFRMNAWMRLRSRSRRSIRNTGPWSHALSKMLTVPEDRACRARADQRPSLQAK
jgi:hypothetical protein